MTPIKGFHRVKIQGGSIKIYLHLIRRENGALGQMFNGGAPKGFRPSLLWENSGSCLQRRSDDPSSVTIPSLELEGGRNCPLDQPPLWSVSGIPETNFTSDFTGDLACLTGPVLNFSGSEPPSALFLCHSQYKSLHSSPRGPSVLCLHSQSDDDDDDDDDLLLMEAK